jgi:hypothetical protein
MVDGNSQPSVITATMAQVTIVAWWAGRRSSSRTVRRCLLIQAGVRSTTHRRGSTSKVD